MQWLVIYYMILIRRGGHSGMIYVMYADYDHRLRVRMLSSPLPIQSKIYNLIAETLIIHSMTGYCKDRYGFNSHFN